jgi:hypothetical protein
MEFNPYLVTLDMSSFADDTMMDDQRSARSRDAVQPRIAHDSTHHPADVRRPRPRDLRFGRGPGAFVINANAMDRLHAKEEPVQEAVE